MSIQNVRTQRRREEAEKRKLELAATAEKPSLTAYAFAHWMKANPDATSYADTSPSLPAISPSCSHVSARNRTRECLAATV